MKMQRSFLPLALALVLIMSAMQVNTGTQAAFSDQTTMSNNTFATGSIDIALANDNEDCNATSNYNDVVSTPFITTSIRPSSVFTTYVCIKNTSTTLPTQWSLTMPGLTDSTSTGTALRSATKFRAWVLTQPTSIDGSGCGVGLDSAGAAASMTAGATEVVSPISLSGQVTVTQSANTQIATSDYQKLCLALALPSSVSDSDPAAATTLQGKVITMSIQIDGNQF